MSNIRTPEEKKEYNINNSVVYRWLEKHEKDGIEGLKSNTGKSNGGTKV